jgi:hypothetical protein
LERRLKSGNVRVLIVLVYDHFNVSYCCRQFENFEVSFPKRIVKLYSNLLHVGLQLQELYKYYKKNYCLRNELQNLCRAVLILRVIHVRRET